MNEWDKLIEASKAYVEAYNNLIELGEAHPEWTQSQRKVVGLMSVFQEANVGSIKNTLYWLEDTHPKKDGE